MAIIRVEKNKDYTCMSNYHLRDMRLSNKAIGLMCKMLSLPENWDYSVQGLTAICKDGRDGIITQLKELEDCGYLKRERNRQANGQVAETIYTLSEKPKSENPTQENPAEEKPTQLNTNILNTKELNIGAEAPKPKRKKKEFVPPTLEEVQNYVDSKIASGYSEYKTIDVYTFFNWYNEADWHMSGGKKVTSWKQCLVTWVRKNKQSPSQPSSQPRSVWNNYGADSTPSAVGPARSVWDIHE